MTVNVPKLASAETVVFPLIDTLSKYLHSISSAIEFVTKAHHLADETKIVLVIKAKLLYFCRLLWGVVSEFGRRISLVGVTGHRSLINIHGLSRLCLLHRPLSP